MSKKNNKNELNKDPYLKREQKKYANPVPSREYILQILEQVGKPLSEKRLVVKLDIDSDEQLEALGFRIRAMIRDGQLMKDRRGRLCLFNRLNLKRGSIQGHPDGFGFFIPADGSQDMFISAKDMRIVMDGDEVLAYQSGIDKKGRLEGKIHEVIKRQYTHVVGRFFIEQGVGFLTPDSKRLTHEISIPLDFSMQAKNGQIVSVEIIAYPSRRTQAVGKVVEVMGDHMAPGMETDVSILAHNIPAVWPEAVVDEAQQIPAQVSESEHHKRADLRALPFVTIDGDDARDFDDAVFAKAKPKGGFQLYVAIADVSHYVKPNTALDKEALNRGNSVYFPSRVVPMLPESLSNEICSLKPNVDRLCMVAELAISAEGKLLRHKFYRAVIHSKARLTYTEVGAWLDDKCAYTFDKAIETSLHHLSDLYDVLSQQRSIRGALDFDSTETKIVFDEHKKIKEIVPVTRNKAHRLIEECMLIANLAAAKFVEKSGLAALYRVHEAPDEEKIQALRAYFSELGIRISGSKKLKPLDLQRTLHSISHRNDKSIIQMMLLRALKQAVYFEKNEGHFGLAYASYTHFTSPIRRYPDLIIHRVIGHIIDNQSDKSFKYTQEEMSRIGKVCSTTERRADDATRDVVNWLKCEFMQDKLGQVFSGHISAVTGFGIFVALDDIYIEGLVHVTSLKNDYYRYDSVRLQMVGERSGKVYQLGDALKVLVARVDLDERKIDFELVEDADE